MFHKSFRSQPLFFRDQNDLWHTKSLQGTQIVSWIAQRDSCLKKFAVGCVWISQTLHLASTQEYQEHFAHGVQGSWWTDEGVFFSIMTNKISCLSYHHWQTLTYQLIINFSKIFSYFSGCMGISSCWHSHLQNIHN